MKRAPSVALRKLTPAEVRAVELSGQNAPLRSVIIQTGLSEQQIATALERQAAWDELHAEAARTTARQAEWSAAQPSRATEMPPLPAAVGEVPEILPVPEPEAEPVLVVEDIEPPDVPAEEDRLYIEEPEPEPDVPASAVEALLARAEASLQPRVRQLAADVRTHLAEIGRLLDNDEQVRKLTDAAAVLRKHLAEYEAELAALLGDEAAPVPTPPVIAVKATIPADDDEADDATVRAWGLDNGWDVKPVGKVRGAVRAAYKAAHEGA